MPRNSENSSAKNNRPVSPRKDTSEKNSSPGDSPDSETNGDRYPLFISVKKTSEAKPRKSTNGENHCNGSSARRGSESSPKSATKSTKVAKESNSPFDSLRREKTDFIIRPRKSPGETGSPTTALKREKSDITLKRSQTPSGPKPRVSASPSSLRREKSEITLKRSQPPGNLTREKSDLVRPRGSASPGPLRREKSDITAKRSQSPAAGTTSVKPRASASPGRLRREKSDLASSRSQSPSGVTREKSDVVKPRGSTSPGSLRREKSDVSKKPPLSPSKSSLSKPRVSASGPTKPDRTSTSSRDSQPDSITSDIKPQTCDSSSKASEQNTNSKTDALKGKDEAANQALTGKTEKLSEQGESIKKSPSSPSKSNLPKPRVFASASLVKADSNENQTDSKDSQEPVTSSDSKPTTVTSPEPLVKNTKVNSVFDAVKGQNELVKKPVPCNIVESPKEGNCQHTQDIKTEQINSKPLRQDKSDIVLNTSSSGNNTEIIESRNRLSSGVETDQRISSPDTAKDSGLDRTTSPVSGSQADCSEKSNSNIAEMSKIPTPTSSNQVSRIPSLTKTSTPPSKIPPKSKIPSFSKKSDEEPKKTSIPTGISDKPASKIPGLQRADPAKENKDPALNGDTVEEVNKQNSKISRIPSAPKSGNQAVSKIPSLNRQESPGNQTTEAVETPKSRIPSVSSSQQSNTTPVSKIPSFSNKHSLTKTPSKEEPESKIPHLNTAPKPTGIPKPEVTAQTGIPKLDLKPAVSTTESRIPQLHSPAQKESGISKPETPTTPTESKIPQFSTPRSKIPAPAGSVFTRKDSEERIKKPKIEETPKVEEIPKVEETPKAEEPQTKATPSPGKVPPPPPPRQDVSPDESKANLDLSMNEDIFSEAKRMEELLRNESIVVEVPTNEDGAPSEAVGKGEEASKLNGDKAPKVEQMVTESVDITESSNNNIKDRADVKKKDQFSFKTFGKKEDQATVSNVTETVSANTLSLGLKKEFKEEKTEELRESITEATSPMENKETPAIDTLGQYEQQSRRSRSRQRKIISPDGDEASKLFEHTVEEADIKPVLDKDLPSMVEDTETNTKPSKSKAKHDKPKFVIESSLGADFYQSKSSQSKDSIADEAKAKEVVVIQNIAFDDSKGVPKTDLKKNDKTETPTNKNSAAFDDVELSSNPRESKVEMKAWSMEELDEKTVKCSCGRGGKCAIM